MYRVLLLLFHQQYYISAEFTCRFVQRFASSLTLHPIHKCTFADCLLSLGHLVTFWIFLFFIKNVFNLH